MKLMDLSNPFSRNDMPRFQFEDVGIDTHAYQEVAHRLASYFETLRHIAEEGTYDTAESSINVPADSAAFEAVISAKDRYSSSTLRYIFVVGIGGSALGAKAIYQALPADADRSCELIFLESPDPFVLAHLEKTVLPKIGSPDETLIIVISKSGTTTETVANFAWLYAGLQSKFGDLVDQRVVAISNEGTPLALEALKKGWGILMIPHQVGGRFSICTAAGLFPLACVGIDVRGFLTGAQEGREAALADTDDNPYRTRALIRYVWYTSGYKTETLFPFHGQLTALCAWHRQLTAESLGKKSASGHPVTLFPDRALGPEDLHATFQLYFGTLTDQSTTFLDVETIPEIQIPENALLPVIAGKHMHSVVRAIEEGVRHAYRTSQKPFTNIQFGALTPHELGTWMQGTMIETMLLAKLLDVNAFDQPSVEEYKKETRRLLAQ